MLDVSALSVKDIEEIADNFGISLSSKDAEKILDHVNENVGDVVYEYICKGIPIWVQRLQSNSKAKEVLYNGQK
jgi:hypothetical protein